MHAKTLRQKEAKLSFPFSRAVVYGLSQTESHIRCDNVFVCVCASALWNQSVEIQEWDVNSPVCSYYSSSLEATLCLSKRRRRKNRTNLLIQLDWTLTKQNAKASHVPNFPALTTNHLFSFEFDHCVLISVISHICAVDEQVKQPTPNEPNVPLHAAAAAAVAFQSTVSN